MNKPQPHEYTPQWTKPIDEEDPDYYQYELEVSGEISDEHFQNSDGKSDKEIARNVLTQIAKADLSDDAYCSILNSQEPGLQPINTERADFENAKVVNPEGNWWVLKIRLDL